jgi:S1-C subfamily serine protease
MMYRLKLSGRVALVAAAFLTVVALAGFAQGIPAQVSTDATAPRGAMVGEVTADGPAAKAGIAPRDFITAVEGETVTSLNQIVAVMRAHKPGDVLKMRIVRAADGTNADVALTLGANPGDPSAAYMGLTLIGLLHIVPKGEKTPMKEPQSPATI